MQIDVAHECDAVHDSNRRPDGSGHMRLLLQPRNRALGHGIRTEGEQRHVGWPYENVRTIKDYRRFVKSMVE